MSPSTPSLSLTHFGFWPCPPYSSLYVSQTEFSPMASFLLVWSYGWNESWLPVEAAEGVFACEEQATPFLTEEDQGMRQVVRGDAVTEQGHEGSFSSALGLLRGSVQEPLHTAATCWLWLSPFLDVTTGRCWWDLRLWSKQWFGKTKQVFKIRSLMLVTISLGPGASFSSGYRIKRFCQLYLRFTDGWCSVTMVSTAFDCTLS